MNIYKSRSVIGFQIFLKKYFDVKWKYLDVLSTTKEVATFPYLDISWSPKGMGRWAYDYVMGPVAQLCRL